jgi:hypothetical protein
VGPNIVNNSQITTRNGWQFEAQPFTPEHPDIEAPFKLVRINGRAPFKGRVYRLWRNSKNPSFCFPVPEDKPVEHGLPKLWFRISPDGALQAM